MSFPVLSSLCFSALSGWWMDNNNELLATFFQCFSQCIPLSLTSGTWEQALFVVFLFSLRMKQDYNTLKWVYENCFGVSEQIKVCLLCFWQSWSYPPTLSCLEGFSSAGAASSLRVLHLFRFLSTLHLTTLVHVSHFNLLFLLAVLVALLLQNMAVANKLFSLNLELFSSSPTNI